MTIDGFLCKLSTKSMQFQYDFLDTIDQIYIYQAIYNDAVSFKFLSLFLLWTVGLVLF